MKSIKLLLLVALGSLIASPLFAHTALKSAAPADESVLREPPAALALDFTDDVQLLKLELVDAGGEAIDIDFTPASAAQKTFSIVLPVLKAAGYMVNWTVLGKDGHKVAGVLEFVVDPQSGESTGTTEAFDDHGKHH